MTPRRGTRFRIDSFLQQAKLTASDGQANDGLGAFGGNSSQGLSTSGTPAVEGLERTVAKRHRFFK
jgi:hypothetical protein